MTDTPEWTEAQRCGYATALWLVQQGYMDEIHMERAAKGIEANFSRAIEACAVLAEGMENETGTLLAGMIRNRKD